MIIVLVVIHVIICIGLIGLVLIQRGRGSGLVESFHGVESMFGTKTNTFLTRTTTILSIMFFFTCLSLAVLSVRQSRSLMKDVKVKPAEAKTAEQKPATAGSAEQKVAEQKLPEQKPIEQKTGEQK
jgi:preprotein translocase subunit SecG